MNKCCLSGNLCKDIELNTSSNGKYWTSNSIAVKREYKNPKGEYDTDFINIIVYGTSAQYLMSYASKGSRVELVGRWQVRKYQDQSGATKTINECIVESISVVNTKRAEEPQQDQYYYEPTYSSNDNQNSFELPMDDNLPF